MASPWWTTSGFRGTAEFLTSKVRSRHGVNGDEASQGEGGPRPVGRAHAGMNGLDVLRKVRVRPRVGVIMVTAVNERDRTRGAEAGAFDCIGNPLNLSISALVQGHHHAVTGC
jgi:hypothetical protein